MDRMVHVGWCLMAGNSQRRGAMRNPGSKKGATVGSGGQRRKALKGKGPTPKATERPHHPAARRKRAAEKRTGASRSPADRAARSSSLMGRNAVLEALRAGIPASALHVQARADADDRWREALRIAVHRRIPVLEVPRLEMDRMADGGVHQGLMLTVPPFAYAEDTDVLTGNLVIALDGINDPRNLGAIARSAAAFGASGLLIPSRRSVGVTASSWKASAGALAKLPVAQVTNLTRTLETAKRAGFITMGLAGDAALSLPDVRTDVLVEPLILVVGSEGAGLSRLVAQTCDWLVRIPMGEKTESLNAAVAASIAMYSFAQARATGLAAT